jgi:hypothetical protein
MRKDTAGSPAEECSNLGCRAELMPFGSMNWELMEAMLTEVP